MAEEKRTEREFEGICRKYKKQGTRPGKTQTSKEVKNTFALGWTDFEGAMQMVSAKNARADKIITLDKKFHNKDKSYIWMPADLRSFLVQNVRE